MMRLRTCGRILVSLKTTRETIERGGLCDPATIGRAGWRAHDTLYRHSATLAPSRLGQLWSSTKKGIATSVKAKGPLVVTFNEVGILEMNVESYRRKAALDRKRGPGRKPLHVTAKELENTSD